MTTKKKDKKDKKQVKGVVMIVLLLFGGTLFLGFLIGEGGKDGKEDKINYFFPCVRATGGPEDYVINATITAIGVDPQNSYIYRTTKTDENGHFIITEVPIGNYSLSATKINYPPQTTSVRVLENDTVIGDFDLEWHAIYSDMPIRIYPNNTHSYPNPPINYTDKFKTNWRVNPLNHSLIINVTNSKKLSVNSSSNNDVWLNTTVPEFANKTMWLKKSIEPYITVTANETGFLSVLYEGGFNSTHEFEYVWVYYTDITTHWNLIAYLGETNTSAAEFSNSIPDNAYVTRRTSDGVYESFNPAAPGINNFTIEHGGGYYVFTDSSYLYERGCINDHSYNTTLLNHWNIVGWTDKPKNASYVANDIGSSCLYVTQRKPDGTYESFNKAVPEINNFDIEKGVAYYVFVMDETVWGRTA